MPDANDDTEVAPRWPALDWHAMSLQQPRELPLCARLRNLPGRDLQLDLVARDGGHRDGGATPRCSSADGMPTNGCWGVPLVLARSHAVAMRECTVF